MLDKLRHALRTSASVVSSSRASSAPTEPLPRAVLKSVGLWLGGWALLTGLFALVCVGAASRAFPDPAAATTPAAGAPTSEGAAPRGATPVTKPPTSGAAARGPGART